MRVRARQILSSGILNVPSDIAGRPYPILGHSDTGTRRGDPAPRAALVVRHVIIFGYGHGLQRAIIDESQHRTPERLIMAQH